MKNKVNLLLGFHGHVPFETLKDDSNTDFIKNYLDLINHFESYPNLKATFHLSGNLLTYLDKKYNDFSSKLRNLLEKNQLELFSGGLYEPIFPFIPKEDRETQIMLMNRLINHTYGYTPFGAWIPEYSWEPSIALNLAKSRIHYTCLSKEYFLNSGLEEDEISGYYLTEEEGRKVAVFPIQHELSKLISTQSPDETVKDLIDSAITTNSEKPSIVLFYNGIPDSNETVQWLKNFFHIINKKTDLLDTKLFNDYFTNNKPKGRIYLSSLQNLRSSDSGSLKSFLLKYPEANLLHKKMLRVSKKINSAREGKSRFKVIKEMINQAHDLLLKGQCNDPYWDNNIAGIYQSQTRHNTYSNLIKAEKLIDSASRHGAKWIQVSEIDYDCDGSDEIIIETETQNIYISPLLGGTIVEHDFRPKNINITNTMSRKLEAYHKPSTSIYDKHQKLNLIDHFLDASVNLTLEACKAHDLKHLTNKVIKPYNIEKIKAKEETCKITFNTPIKLEKLPTCPEIELRKQLNTRSGDSSLFIDYILTNKSQEKCSFIFAVEFNFNITAKSDKDVYFCLDGNINNKTLNPEILSSEVLKESTQICICNKNTGMKLILFWNLPCTILRYPIETLSYNHGKLESIYQGSTIFLSWELTLEPETPLELTLKQDITAIEDLLH